MYSIINIVVSYLRLICILFLSLIMDIPSWCTANLSDMSLEFLRFKTFEKLERYFDPEMVAYLGMYLSPTIEEQDRVCCYNCNVVISDWENKNLEDLHSELSPNCTFSLTNVKIQYQYLTNLILHSKFILYCKFMVNFGVDVTDQPQDVVTNQIAKSVAYINKNRTNRALIQDILDMISNRTRYMHNVSKEQLTQIADEIKNTIETGTFRNTTTIKPIR